MNKQKAVKWATTIIITLSILSIGYFKFKISYLRFNESINDLFNSFKFYIFQILKKPNSTVVTVEQI